MNKKYKFKGSGDFDLVAIATTKMLDAEIVVFVMIIINNTMVMPGRRYSKDMFT